MKLRHVSVAALATLLCASSAGAQNFRVSRTAIFAPQGKRVLLLRDAASEKRVILFQTGLRINTDGSPMSYHPQDPRGRELALNNVCNAIAVRRVGASANLCLTRFGEAIGVFERWRDTGYRTVPAGFRITWQNVLPAVEAGGTTVPCVFQSGPFKGYFGSLTALKNALPRGARGECEIDNQVNPLAVPALVLVGGTNVVRDFGARVGDLLVAYNPKTRLFSAAVIGDVGPEDNIGEGTVALNMRLRGTTTPPTNKAETFRLSINDAQVLIAIIPTSRTFEEARPFTAENVGARVASWQRATGFATPEAFVEFMKSFQPRLD